MRSLRAFEAAARHNSFVKAGDELGVTPGAIAQQVRLLENWLGQPLFIRQAHGLVPATNTKLVQRQLSYAFDLLSEAVQALRTAMVPDQVRIAALPSIAQLWLSPLLPQIRKQCPHVEISVSALDEPPNFKRDLFDFAFFYANDDDAHTHSASSVILKDVIFPVCAPSLKIASLSDLSSYPLIHDGTWRDDWERWLAFVGATKIDAQRGPVFSLYSLALQSALDGDGVLMGRRALVQQHLKEGRLVKPFDAEIPSDNLLLLVPDDQKHRPAHPELAHWLHEAWKK